MNDAYFNGCEIDPDLHEDEKEKPHPEKTPVTGVVASNLVIAPLRNDITVKLETKSELYEHQIYHSLLLCKFTALHTFQYH